MTEASPGAGASDPVDDVAGYIHDLRALKVRVGSPSLQELQRRSGVARSTLSDALNPRRPELPRLEVCLAFVRACGASAAEVARWRARWELIAQARDERRSRPTAVPAPADVPTSASAEALSPASVQEPAPAAVDASRSVPPEGGAAEGGAAVAADAVVPRQLPAAVRHFTGRLRELKELDALLGDRIPDCGAVVISAIAGTAGVGKTSLAVHFAHRVAHRFPDGQLFANLRGFDPAGPPLEAATVARGFLEALGVPPGRIPADPEGRLALFRSRLAGTRTLVVLDNAREAAQVRPLLPGSDSCLVLVTSRNRMPGLVALDGAVPLALDVLSQEEARELLARRLGSETVLGEPDAADELIELCARLPLALNIAAARAAGHPGTPLRVWAHELRDTRERLDALSTGDAHADVRAVLSWSYQALDARAARLFRLLGLHPGPHIGTAAAASLAGLPLAETRRLLDELHHAHLIATADRDRYTFHDLLRAYAAEQAAALDPAPERAEGTLRILDHYLHTARRAGSLAYAADASWSAPALAQPAVGVVPEALEERQQALDWYREEQPVLERVVTRAHQDGFDDHTWRLAGTQVSYLLKSGLWQQWQQVSETALAAAERADDPAGRAHAHRWLGQVHRSQGRQPEAHAELRRALDLFASLGDLPRQGRTQLDIAITYGEEHAYVEAVAEGREALALFERIEDADGQALALNTVGWYLTVLGEPREALPYCRRALELSRACGNLPGQSSILDSIGYIHHQLGEYQEALPAYEESLRLRRTVGDYFLQAEIHTHIGDTHLALGDPEAARHSWTQSLAILDHLQHRDAEGVRARLERLDRLG
ncbi:ATP-binding protein [Streptacidiphilus jiangxiensis]|uniref:Tfp pilus assembly protein PilF n=1 Tax=Streptacidiphilus jiangxiensis TaxID=235985 RepID=A0A1H7YDF1_STRJI|nr:tetratricopeptide repeat protein [Streptacidiphilus jiangxiensis]SEM44256.1 Tfp pilus assembly protein PilF [Streptacidiphilus jiangxiensis]